MVDHKTRVLVVAYALEPDEEDVAIDFSVCDERVKPWNCSQSYFQFSISIPIPSDPKVAVVVASEQVWRLSLYQQSVAIYS